MTDKLKQRYIEQRRRARQIKLLEAERKREVREKAETVIVITGLFLLGKLLDSINKPDEPAKSPKEPDKDIPDIIDAEFVDVTEEPETPGTHQGTTALVIKS